MKFGAPNTSSGRYNIGCAPRCKIMFRRLSNGGPNPYGLQFPKCRPLVALLLNLLHQLLDLSEHVRYHFRSGLFEYQHFAL